MKCPICGVEFSPKVYELHVKDCEIENKSVEEEDEKEVTEEKVKSGKK